MERINEILLDNLKDLLITIQRAKNLVDDGKEVLCSNGLQGALMKCNNICLWVEQNELMAEQISKK